MFEIVAAAVPPPGSFQTAIASTRMIAMLRRCLLRSGPTPDSRLVGADELGGRDVLEGRARADRLRDELGREAVADPEVRVDVPPIRRGALELGAQLAHED